MNSKQKSEDSSVQRELRPGLYLVATPIGSARDITLRALDILSAADVIAAEDTRRARKLLDIHGISVRGRPMMPYHDHNGPQQRPRLLSLIAEGKSVAYVSDAGTPLVADPGYRLAQEAIAAGLPVTSAPGPSALLAAISVSGLPSDRFFFAGFPPAKAVARQKFIRDIAEVDATLVLFEAPRRLTATLAMMVRQFGGGRHAAICRELTKRFEEVRRGTLEELADALAVEREPKGEVVVVVGPPVTRRPDARDIDAALQVALRDMSVKDSATVVAETFGIARKDAYRRALELAKEK